jgi:hypothetical protein
MRLKENYPRFEIIMRMQDIEILLMKLNIHFQLSESEQIILNNYQVNLSAKK